MVKKKRIELDADMMIEEGNFLVTREQLQLYILENRRLNNKIREIENLLNKADMSNLLHMCYEIFLSKLRIILYGDRIGENKTL